MTIYIAVYEYDRLLGYLLLDYVEDKDYSQELTKEYPTWHYAKYTILESNYTGIVKRPVRFV